MKQITLITSFLFVCGTIFAQSKDVVGIKKTIVIFFEWGQIKNNSGPQFSIIKEIVKGDKKKIKLDTGGVELYLNKYRKSGLFSNLYLNDLRGYFYEIGNDLDRNPEIELNAIVKIDGLDLNIPLKSYEPELILNYYKNGLYKKVVIASNKAIVQFYIPNYKTKMLFTLTKEKNKWLIDTIGYYD